MASLPADAAIQAGDGLPTTVHWVLHPFDAGSILKLRAESAERQVPDEGEVVRRAFLVDAQTCLPVLVRIVQRLDWTELDEPRCVVVVVRERPADPS